MSGVQFGQLRVLIAPLVIFSLVTNLAVLVSPIFMMQVLDRVVPSGNTATLLILMMVALGALMLNAHVEAIRDRCLHRVARWLEQVATPMVLSQTPADQPERLEQLNLLRGFFGGTQAISALNFCWMPLFLFALVLIHPLYLVVVVVVLGLMQALKLITAGLSKHQTSTAQQFARLENQIIQRLKALPSQPRMPHIRANLQASLSKIQTDRLASLDRAERPDIVGKSANNFLRMGSQLLALSLGAYLVSQELLSAGAMIAASIIVSKTVTTAEQSIEVLRQWPAIRAALSALGSLYQQPDSTTETGELNGAVNCSNIITPRGAGAPPRLDRVNFELEPGQCLVIIGDAASGKTSLLTALAGIDPPPIGSITLDQTDVRHLGAQAHKTAIGFLPQHATLMPGSVADNISGFDPSATDDSIINAAKKARVHGMISALPEGYKTDLCAAPYLLTAGQQQQIALAVALFHDPKYLFLDEPNSLLDRHAERALCEVLANLKEASVTLVMILHRSGAVGLADKILVMDRGRMTDFGPRAEVLGRQYDGHRQLNLPLRETSLQDLSDWIGSQFTRGNDASFSQKAIMVGTELFQAAFLNGPRDQAREVRITFTFVDDLNCELRMVEKGFTKAEEIMVKINATLAKGSALDLEDGFTEQERPLVLAHRLASRIEVSNNNNQAMFFAHLHMNGKEAESRPH
ncbi:MAG: ATP-binding cassette domain-containing protein [Paracoccaceae bacterium]